MCGIVGFTSYKPEPEKIKKFTNTLSHRGPDQEGFKIIEMGDLFLHLGSARLIIRGTEIDSMPMQNRVGNYITYNGEIYDISSLKSNITKPVNTSNDTIHLLDFLTENENKINDINGMFSFAFYNSRKKLLTIARDRLGVKPIYYSIDKDGYIVFSSEMNNILEFCNIKKVTSNDINNLLLFNGQVSHHNFNKHLEQLKPGQLLQYHQDRQIKITSYSKLQKTKNINPEDFENTMLEVLEDHLEADTNVDMFLSGGVDSSIIAYLTKEKLNKKIRHFSLSFESDSFDEKSSFDEISTYLNLEPKVFKFKDNEISDLVNEALMNMNSLILDPSFVPTYYLCKNTSKFTKAVISGDGADELFGGYEWYRAIKIKKLFPDFLLELISSSRILNLQTKDNYLNLSQKLQYFFKNINNNNLIQLLIWQSPKLNFSNSDIESYKNYIKQLSLENISEQSNLQELDEITFMYSNILQKIDIAGMSNGLEIRPPYLDDRIINFSKSLDAENNLSFKQSKLFLRDYMYKNNIPNFDKPKHGFAFPIRKWYDQSGRSIILNKLNNDIIFEKYYQNTHKSINFQNPNNIELRLIWSLYVLSFWFEKNEIELESV
tara:strand:- start:4622 stop:6430 length:1809 start_codon:yes stop_codon:yes gene_type:complete